MENAHQPGLNRMLHKRQRVVATESSSETTTRGGRVRSTSTTELVAEDTSTGRQRERPSFMTATTTSSTRSTAAAAVTSTTDDSTSSSSSTTARGRGTTSSSSSSTSVGTTPASRATNTGFNEATATPINTNPKSNSSSSSTNGGAVAGAIIAVIAVLAIGIGFFVWRKRRNNRRAKEGFLGSGSGSGGVGGAGGGYKKQEDKWDGHNTNGMGNEQSMTRDDSSLFGGREKTFSGESFNQGPENGAGGYGATSNWNQPQPQQQYYNAQGGEPTWNNGSNVYPPANQPLPPVSTTNLLAHQDPTSSMSNLPASLAAGGGGGGGAGAAGFGAARLVAAQSVASSSPRNSISNHHHHDSSHYQQHQSIEQRELQQELDNRRQSFLNKTQPPQPQAPLALATTTEESPFGESEGQGEIRIVKGTFDPSLDDELVLYPGDKVQVLMKYDDGWALGLNLSSGVPPSKGVFPFDCLGQIVPAPLASEIRSPSNPSPPSDVQRSLSPINPANIPLPPPTPTLLSPINESERPLSVASTATREGPPQLAPFERSDSPLSPDFPPTSLTVPSSTSNSSTLNGGSPTSPTMKRMSMDTTKLKRHSSLIASRDADLFVALGEVLDKEKH
ncbi:uncharacterized protein JCM6883_002866 [Sporobolomyces salmoneus]|uniref:uncharacterized protein n=1 Tax=Sporobolomyces salmoneus TaxID=183962 RepID=UPI003179E00A